MGPNQAPKKNNSGYAANEKLFGIGSAAYRVPK
jgi:hypothetical protein